MIISSIDALDGGPSSAMIELAAALATRGESVDLFAAQTEGREIHRGARFAQDCGVRLHLVRVARQSRFRFSMKLFTETLRHSRQIDVVSLHGFYQFSSIVAYIVSLVRRAPLLIEPHGTFEPYQEARGSRIKPIFMRVIGRRIIRHARSLMVASEQEEKGVRQSLRRSTRVVTIVGLGVELHRGSFRPRDFDSRQVLFLSRVAPKKRLDKLLVAVRLLHEWGQSVHLTVCGDGEADYVDSLKSINVPVDSVTWAGHVEGRVRREIEDQACLFVLPSDNENFGLAVVQAMAIGLPVITTETTGASEHVSRADGGWVLIEPDAVELAASISDALSDPVELAQRGSNGRRHAQHSLTWGSVAEKWVAVAASC